jgi:hypothetical protein
MAHRFKCAEDLELASDHVRIGRTLGARVESEVLGMLDGDPIPIFETENERTERSLPDETPDLGTNDGGLHCDDLPHVNLWAFSQDHGLATSHIHGAVSRHSRLHDPVRRNAVYFVGEAVRQPEDAAQPGQLTRRIPGSWQNNIHNPPLLNDAMRSTLGMKGSSRPWDEL